MPSEAEDLHFSASMCVQYNTQQHSQVVNMPRGAKHLDVCQHPCLNAQQHSGVIGTTSPVVSPLLFGGSPLSFQVSGLLSEVAQLQQQLSKQQVNQQAEALQASKQLVSREPAALQLAAAEARAVAAEARAAAAEARAAAAEARTALAEAQLATGSGPADAVAAVRLMRKVAELCDGAVHVADQKRRSCNAT
jgi:hypothetical protein